MTTLFWSHYQKSTRLVSNTEEGQLNHKIKMYKYLVNWDPPPPLVTLTLWTHLKVSLFCAFSFGALSEAPSSRSSGCSLAFWAAKGRPPCHPDQELGPPGPGCQASPPTSGGLPLVLPADSAVFEAGLSHSAIDSLCCLTALDRTPLPAFPLCLAGPMALGIVPWTPPWPRVPLTGLGTDVVGVC